MCFLYVLIAGQRVLGTMYCVHDKMIQGLYNNIIYLQDNTWYDMED